MMLKQTLLTGWNFMRWLRLILGLYMGVQAIMLHDAFSGVFSAFFLFQSLTNTGCCGAGGCAVPMSSSRKMNKTEETEFEEVK